MSKKEHSSQSWPGGTTCEPSYNAKLPWPCLGLSFSSSDNVNSLAGAWPVNAKSLSG